MDYHYSKISELSFEEAVDKVTIELQKEGFGVLTEVDIQATLKNKLDIDFKKYKILGACHPTLAHQAILAEDKIGVFLPCNILVQEHENGQVEISTVSPKASMITVRNTALLSIAKDVEIRLHRVIDATYK
jgi:uncharacterized protein (DUF302 family)